MKTIHIASALLLSAFSSAWAAPVTLQFGAQIDNSDLTGYDAGATLSGQISYDTDLTPTSPPLMLDGDVGELTTYSVSLPNAFQLDLGTHHVASSDLSMAILDNLGTGGTSEAISFVANNLTIDGQATTGYVLLSFLASGNQHVLSSTLPSFLNLADFNGLDMPPQGSVFSSSEASAQVANFHVTSLANTTAVPELASFWMTLTGLLPLGLLVRRRH